MEINQKHALLIIDMINDFQFKHGPILSKQAVTISHNIMKLKHKMKRNGHPIIYINDHYSLWQADFVKIAETCKNPLSEKIIDLIYPDKDDYFLLKPKHSAFYETALNTLLKTLDIRNLIITGIAGNICVLFTANDAYMRDYNLIIPSDCCASNNEEDNKYALVMMKNILKASIPKSENIKLI